MEGGWGEEKENRGWGRGRGEEEKGNPLGSPPCPLSSPSQRLSPFTGKAASKRCNTPNEEKGRSAQGRRPGNPLDPPCGFCSILGHNFFLLFLFKGWLVSGPVYWQIASFRIITMDWVSLCRVPKTAISMFLLQF